MKWLVILLLLLLPAGCSNHVSYTTRHFLEVALPSPPPEQIDVELWTEQLEEIWKQSVCKEINSRSVLKGLKETFDNGLPVRLYWRSPPMSIGRIIYAEHKEAFQHELTHTFIDGYGIEVWGNDPHHKVMCRCGLVIARDLCSSLGTPFVEGASLGE